MSKFEYRLPRGTRDFPPEDMVKRNYVEKVVRGVFERYGFQEVQTPIFETFALFALRSGDEIRSKMFVFPIDEGEMTLRPELTAPVCRMLALGEFDLSKKPLRLYYIGQCYRYEEPQAARFREFWQAGAELMGSPYPEADAEVIAMAVQTARELGIENHEVKVGNIEILRGFLEDSGIPEEIRNRLIGPLDIISSSIDKLRTYENRLRNRKPLAEEDLSDLARRADRVRMWKEEEDRKITAGESSIPASLREKLKTDSRFYRIKSLYKEKAIKELMDFIEATVNETKWIQKTTWIHYGIKIEGTGGESKVEIPEKVADTLLQMIDLFGEKDETLNKAKRLFFDSPRALKAIENFKITLDLLPEFGVERFITDLSVARGLEFYTGTVFEIDCPLLGAEKQICGGGRYDNLVYEFGGPRTPATGFAIGFDRLVLSAEKSGFSFPSAVRVEVYLIPIGEDILGYAASILQKMRDAGIKAEMDMLRQKTKESLSFASKMSVPYVILVGHEEKKDGVVSLRNMETKQQVRLSLDNAIEIITRAQQNS